LNFDNWAAGGADIGGNEPRLSAAEGTAALDHILRSFEPGEHLYVSCTDLGARIVARMHLFDRPARPAETGVLPMPERGRDRLSAEYRPPRNDTERAMARIWEEYLGVAPIGIDDDYFEMGGDSISSLQIIARAREQGLGITAAQLFEHSCIAALELHAETDLTATIDQGAICGPAPLTPVQHWFFDQAMPSPQHWNVAGIMPAPMGLTRHALRLAVRGLLAHHDMLRCRFQTTPDGWRQYFGPVGGEPPVRLVNLATVHVGSHDRAIEAAAEAAQASFDLLEGPLFAVVWFTTGDPASSHLLVIAHHLLVDAFSWRIVMADLRDLVSQSISGTPSLSGTASLSVATPVLPSKTTSVKEWVERQSHLARQGAFDDELAYWLDPERRAVAPLPFDLGDSTAPDPEGSMAVVSRVFPSKLSQKLTRLLPRRLGCSVDVLLLTLLGQTLTHWTGERLSLVDVEGFGRDDVGGGDLSRTVGWFTAIHPVLLEAETGKVWQSLERNRERLRRIPRRGLGYGALRYLAPRNGARHQLESLPPAEVSFVYLGSQAGVDGEAPAGAMQPMGRVRAPDNPMPYRLSVNALVAGDQLRIMLAFSDRRYRRSTIEGLADELHRLAAALEDDRRDSTQPPWTAADREAFGWSDADLKGIAAAIGNLNA
jgi:non-ribosomal peptide synthase protein (TIGR01720 family)